MFSIIYNDDTNHCSFYVDKTDMYAKINGSGSALTLAGALLAFAYLKLDTRKRSSTHYQLLLMLIVS